MLLLCVELMSIHGRAMQSASHKAEGSVWSTLGYKTFQNTLDGIQSVVPDAVLLIVSVVGLWICSSSISLTLLG